MQQSATHPICLLDDLEDPGSRAFELGDGEWPFRGFLVRQGDTVVAYRNYCMHVGHPLNWKPHEFLTRDRRHIICASHGAMYEIESGVCVAGPCAGKRLAKLEVTVRDGAVCVRLPHDA